MKSTISDPPKVSIVLPCYNAEKVVSSAIESAANSSIAKDCELIIVNDGSTDHTGDVIETTCQHIHNLKIRVIKTKNLGASKARNTALDVAEGKYVAFLDADDRISSCMLENMLVFSEERGADFSYCEQAFDITLLCKNAVIPELTTKEKVFSTLLYRSNSIRFTSVLYCREIIEKYSLRFDESLRYGEDTAFLWKYAIRCTVFLSFNRPFYYYARDNKSSAMHRVCWEMTDMLKSIEQIRAYIPPSEIALLKSYDEYMIPRYIIFLQKYFAMADRREMFDRLKMQYSSVSFFSVIKKARFIIQVSAILYWIMPALYFHFFRILGRCGYL